MVIFDGLLLVGNKSIDIMMSVMGEMVDVYRLIFISLFFLEIIFVNIISVEDRHTCCFHYLYPSRATPNSKMLT